MSAGGSSDGEQLFLLTRIVDRSGRCCGAGCRLWAWLDSGVPDDRGSDTQPGGAEVVTFRTEYRPLLVIDGNNKHHSTVIRVDIAAAVRINIRAVTNCSGGSWPSQYDCRDPRHPLPTVYDRTRDPQIDKDSGHCLFEHPQALANAVIAERSCQR